jgi:predicted dehydrogenase
MASNDSNITNRKLRWGILSTAKIGTQKVIPALQTSRHGRVTVIASRNLDTARAAAAELGIPMAHGSYEALLENPDVDAVYIPLPNHLHVPWSIKALKAGKHVLCEKPVGMSSAEAQQLVEAAGQHPHLKIMEAFMYRFHPQWRKARELVQGGHVGELRTIQSFFSYSNPDPKNIRNIPDFGGGGLMDIGCYCISLARFLFETEPVRVMGVAEVDPDLAVDRLASGILDFGLGTATFTCSTQLTPYQRVNIFGTEGRIEIEIPFNAPPDRPCRMWHQQGADLRELSLEVCDQYTLQGDAFAHAVIEDQPVPTSLEDAVANMRVIESVKTSARQSAWIQQPPR